MRLSRSIFLVFFVLLASGCREKHLITNKKYCLQVESDFSQKKVLASNREKELFTIFKQNLTLKQTEALEFLFAYMPLSDLADYSGEFFLANAKAALRTREETSWSNDIPEEIFLHYVLPCRVNNENLDSFRIVYYDEIHERIRGMNIEQAALELNHWCHEKVTYQPADSRTSGPLSTILSARGRCGEESTLTVSALRTAGIPARQVYTPRWAHTDDNHAWVEVWINGKWFYMGACEPEPILDRGWFTEPARRAMLVHTKSFGAPYGNENLISGHRDYSEVNNLAKYAITKRFFVKVTDRDGVPLNGASVEYQLYNYAEFFPLAITTTDNSGLTSFETGLGDLLIWARNNDDFGFSKISVGETDTVSLKVGMGQETTGKSFDLEPPVIRAPFDGPPKDLAGKNSERIEQENKLREAYTDSWMKPADARTFAGQINCDPEKTMELIAKSMGNYKSIVSFLGQIPGQYRKLAYSLLQIIAEKDLRDTKPQVLKDHLENVILPDGMAESDELFIRYILNPRISDELLVSWRGFLRNELPENLAAEAPRNPLLIKSYIEKTISISDSANFYKAPLTPKGVHQLKVSDQKSRSVYFVAVCRTLGIPSRLEPGSRTPQYYFNSEWNDVYFTGEEAPTGSKGYLRIYSGQTDPVPEYYTHFTIARFKDGRYNTLEFENNTRITDFKEELQLSPGHYMLVTGNRLSDGKVLSEISFFDLAADQHLTLEVKVRQEYKRSNILGHIDLKRLLEMIPAETQIVNKIFEKGLVIAWIEPEKEPTKHVLNDLPLLKTELDTWGGGFIFLTDSVSAKKGFDMSGLKGMPSNSLAANDNNKEVLKFVSGSKSDPAGFPYLILTDREGNILFTSAGYRIGIGEQILKNIR